MLDSYSAERQPVFASTAKDFIEKSIHEDRDFLAAFNPGVDRVAFEHAWNLRRTGASSEVGAFEPHYGGSPIVPAAQESGPRERTGAVGRHVFAARPGHHLAPQPLSCGRNASEALGTGFTLLALGADSEALAALFVAAARRIGLPLAILTDSRDGGRERWEAALVLVRPDHFVAWCGEAATHAEDVLRVAAGG